MSFRTLALFAIPAALLAAPGVQAPHAPWRTLATAHYRIHYPPILSDWAQEVAGRIEGIHAQVTAWVGYESPVPIQVVLADPVQEANGASFPLLSGPYVVLWRTEPRSDSLHGSTMTSWTELLVTHELTHIHHLMRPARKAGAFTSLFGLPTGPLMLKAPRWVMEGYATLLEGRITGSGRPHGALRAAILRQWALAGKLPAYQDLSADRGFLGSDMAYMAGSAYLEWLERQRPAQPEILQILWKQLASRKGRTFEQAFLATFGFSAQDGYQRFQAEAAHDALDLEARLKAQGLRQGELWLRSRGAVADLAVSPDGTRLLGRLERKGRSELCVWDLAPHPGPASPSSGRPDPLNAVADAPPEFIPPRLRARLGAVNGHAPHEAQWVDDHTIRFQLKHPDGEGMLHRQPAQWRLATGVDTRSEMPGPRWRVLEPIHRHGDWVLVMDGQTVPLPGQPAGRAFVDEPRRQILAACELDGTWNLVRVPYRSSGPVRVFEPAQRLTRTVSAAWNPAPSPDGRWLYFTTLDARGMEIRKLDLGLPPLETLPAPEPRLLTRAAVLPPPRQEDALPGPVPPPPSHPYSARENLITQVASSASVTPAGTSLTLGLGGEDLLGRLSWQVLAGLGNGPGPRGATLGLSSTAWRWKPSLALFSALERPSLQGTAPAPKDQERRGAEFALEYDNLGEPLFWASPVVALERDRQLPRTGEGALLTRTLAGLRSGLQTLWGRGPWTLALRPALDLYAGSSRSGAEGQGWNASRASVTLRLGTPVTGLTLMGEEGRLTGGSETFHLGGVTTSLVPLSLDMNRVEQAALPAYSAQGDHFLRYRGEVGSLFRVYLEGSALWNTGQERPAFLRVAGAELALSLKSPGGEQIGKKLKVELGVHKPLDGVMKGRIVGTFNLVIRP